MRILIRGIFPVIYVVYPIDFGVREGYQRGPGTIANTNRLKIEIHGATTGVNPPYGNLPLCFP
ncbi:hypothetical protein PEC302110_25880 [Pectobacterium araliae]|uniref:Uncharacterized protein n=1 Tax=Pectobacterium araliae TaxID=3073862 RepID=A0AAN0KBB9_9GAMM|nr:hypothetical protein PEC302110_25880 [Pectobacterium sp. MAFF 302110]